MTAGSFQDDDRENPNQAAWENFDHQQLDGDQRVGREIRTPERTLLERLDPPYDRMAGGELQLGPRSPSTPTSSALLSLARHSGQLRDERQLLVNGRGGLQ